MAIVFVTEIDNIAYEVGLGERVRTRMEIAGHMSLSEQELTALTRTKAVHIVLIILSIFATVVSKDFNARFVIVPLGYLLGGVAESLNNGVVEFLKVVGFSALGYISFMSIMMLVLAQDGNGNA